MNDKILNTLKIMRRELLDLGDKIGSLGEKHLSDIDFMIDLIEEKQRKL